MPKAFDRVRIARKVSRPTSLDYITHIFEDFIEFHGDRNFADDKAIVGGEQVINVTGGVSALTVANMDALSLYIMDMLDAGDTAFAFGLNKYAQKIAQLQGANSFMSDNMKDAYNRYGLAKEYNGLLIGGFSGQKKASDGELLVPDKRIFGVSGKIGTICDRGDLRVYQTMDNNKEKVSLKFTGYEYGIKITRPDKVAKIAFTQ